ncbi:hypothetical protein EDB83DRAFT_2530318 [Lactarius deliciosus]|nr:hypothetical protein EDB83DRAFT_2530318 [Lactarius deliciosus]
MPRALAPKSRIFGLFASVRCRVAQLAPFRLDFPWHSASRLAIDLYALPPFPSLIYTLTHTPPTCYLRRSTSVAHGPPSPVFALQEARKSLIDRPRVLAPCAVFVLNSPSRRITHLSYSFQDVKDRRPSVLTAHEPPSRHRQRSRGLLRSSSDLEEGIVMFVVRLTRVRARAPLSRLVRLSYLFLVSVSAFRCFVPLCHPFPFTLTLLTGLG